MSFDVREWLKNNVYHTAGEFVQYLKSTGLEFPDVHSYDKHNTDREIYSWYIVSEEFAMRARRANYCIVEHFGVMFYGRTDYGQAMDTEPSFVNDFELYED